MPKIIKNGRVYGGAPSESVWEGTQEQYDAIVNKDPNIIYYITDGAVEPIPATNIEVNDTGLPYTAPTVQNALNTLSYFTREDVSTQIANGYANLTDVTAELFRVGNVGIFQIRCHCTGTIASGTVTLTTNIKSDPNYSFRGALGCIDNKSGFMEYNNKTFLIRCPASTVNYIVGMIVFPIGF